MPSKHSVVQVSAVNLHCKSLNVRVNTRNPISSSSQRRRVAGYLIKPRMGVGLNWTASDNVVTGRNSILVRVFMTRIELVSSPPELTREKICREFV